ncbi:alpha/beta hydrolase [Jannaschia pohangensis]|uniref:Acetyl esterase/lipase n=1 Tax=Jannaschia pohangensis TaxID=390807 RepID=A0A1I3U9E4_9RHOB|nr:alpha/beta hydrolase [Jannaschia pohangensis]SFJ78407.1 Acetyl esterase/lipase [Jannaschia pohangensis]
MLRSCLGFLFLVLAACNTASGPGVTTVTYCGSQKMQIHGARDAALPTVLYVHGGGWESGDRTTGFERRMIAPLNDAGIVVATIDYRLAPAHLHPSQIEDVTCALRSLASDGADLGIDAGRIGIMGDSAGGHLAALAALSGDRFGGVPGIEAVATFYGVFDLVNLEPSLAVAAVAQNFPTPEARISGTPLLDIDGTAPPFLIAHGREDRFVNLAQSVKLAQLLINAGHRPILAVVENADHGFVPRGGVPDPSVEQVIALTVAFFQDHL